VFRYHPNAYLANWTFNIQRMLTSTLLVQAGYVGSKMTHVLQNRFHNQNDPNLLSMGARLLDLVPNPYFGKVTSGTLSFPTVQRRQLLRPFPQYLQLLVPRDGYGDQHYQSFQLRVDKQYSRGFTMSLAYTISKAITNNSESGGDLGPHNAQYNPDFSRSIDKDDIPQRLVFSYIYELPFGKGHSRLATGPLSAIIGKWQLNGITIFQSGVPLRITGPDTTNLLDFSANAGRANRLCDPVLSKDQRSTERYFDTSCFAAAPPFTLPTDSMTQPRLRDYGRTKFDASLIRTQVIKERYNLQFRAEVFNVFNTPALSLGRDASVAVGNPQFARVLSGTGPREITLGLRFLF
jgi:hypothetical protein